MVTSALPGEGQSTTALNLASSLAQAGGTTLLIEADLHRSSLSKKFELSGDRGLSEVQSGSLSMDEAVVKLTGTDLDFLGGGRVNPHFSPPDGESTRWPRHYFVALGRRARRTVKYASARQLSPASY